MACGEPAGQYGVVAQGACGYTNSDGSLPFPKEEYTAAADTNDDYPGSCGRCYQVCYCSSSCCGLACTQQWQQVVHWSSQHLSLQPLSLVTKTSPTSV